MLVKIMEVKDMPDVPKKCENLVSSGGSLKACGKPVMPGFRVCTDCARLINDSGQTPPQETPAATEQEKKEKDGTHHDV